MKNKATENSQIEKQRLNWTDEQENRTSQYEEFQPIISKILSTSQLNNLTQTDDADADVLNQAIYTDLDLSNTSISSASNSSLVIDW